MSDLKENGVWVTLLEIALIPLAADHKRQIILAVWRRSHARLCLEVEKASGVASAPPIAPLIASVLSDPRLSHQLD